jgi:hypothetical protein
VLLVEGLARLVGEARARLALLCCAVPHASSCSPLPLPSRLPTPVQVAVDAYCNSGDDKVALYWAPLVIPGQAVEWQQVGVQRCSSDEAILQLTQVRHPLCSTVLHGDGPVSLHEHICTSRYGKRATQALQVEAT